MGNCLSNPSPGHPSLDRKESTVVSKLDCDVPTVDRDKKQSLEKKAYHHDSKPPGATFKTAFAKTKAGLSDSIALAKFLAHPRTFWIRLHFTQHVLGPSTIGLEYSYETEKGVETGFATLTSVISRVKTGQWEFPHDRVVFESKDKANAAGCFEPHNLYLNFEGIKPVMISLVAERNSGGADGLMGNVKYDTVGNGSYYLLKDFVGGSELGVNVFLTNGNPRKLHCISFLLENVFQVWHEMSLESRE
jgi:hypothetical protein